MYVELHSRSAFSFLEGASIPEELVAVCANLGMPAMASLDRDGVYGSPRFHLAAKKAEIKAHIGAEVTCAAFSSRRHYGGFRLPLLVASRSGYQNLCRLITKMKLRAGDKEGASASSADFIKQLICTHWLPFIITGIHQHSEQIMFHACFCASFLDDLYQ